MAKQKDKNSSKKFRVLKFMCPNCGEEKYYIIFCDHCGESLEYSGTELLTLEQIQQRIDEGVDIVGADKLLALMDEDIDMTEDLDSEIGSLDADELDGLFDDNTLEPL